MKNKLFFKPQTEVQGNEKICYHIWSLDGVACILCRMEAKND